MNEKKKKNVIPSYINDKVIDEISEMENCVCGNVIKELEIENFKRKLIVNMTKSEKDKKTGDIIKTVADKYLGITVDVLKPIDFDKQAEKSILLTNPLLLHEKGSSISIATYEIALALLKA